jgi:hypothetical protein
VYELSLRKFLKDKMIRNSAELSVKKFVKDKYSRIADELAMMAPLKDENLMPAPSYSMGGLYYLP